MNKLLISVDVPSIEQTFELFIPINRKMGTVKKKILECIDELTGGAINNKDFLFFDIDTGVKYDNDIYVKESGIKNGTRLILI